MSEEPSIPPEERLSVLLSPLPGHTDAEVMERLETGRASGVQRLAPRFVSAEISAATLPALQEVAWVERKPLRETRTRAVS